MASIPLRVRCWTHTLSWSIASCVVFSACALGSGCIVRDGDERDEPPSERADASTHREERDVVDSGGGTTDANAASRDGSTEVRDTETAGDGDADSGVEPTRTTGESCQRSDQCRGGRCLTAYPAGYCTHWQCEYDAQCTGPESVCATFARRPNRCLTTCESTDDCRDGYGCRSFGSDGERACRPKAPIRPLTFGGVKRVLEARCQPEKTGLTSRGVTYRFSFDIGADSNGFLMVPFVTNGKVRPETLKTPKTSVDMVRGYRHHNSRFTQFNDRTKTTGIGTYGRVAFDWPIVVPYAPSYSDLLVPGGTYELTVVTVESRGKPCLYVLDHEGEGTTLDLNFYLVGANGMDAVDARTDKDLEVVLHWVEHIYKKVGVEIGDVRYRDVSSKVEKQYKRITSKNEARKLMAYGAPPNGSLEGHLTIDVFLVNDLQVKRNREGNVLGMSAGVPGSGGLHGNARNGLVFKVTDLGEANKHVGHVMAHEIGHFLGLRHTTERVHGHPDAERLDNLLGTTDPIEDTPVCEDIVDKVQNNPFGCEDADNLMYPFAPPPRRNVDPHLTPKQGKAMKANPLIRKPVSASTSE